VRNGPYGTHAVVIRKTQPEETTYKRGASHSAAMMRIDVADVISAIASLGERS